MAKENDADKLLEALLSGDDADISSILGSKERDSRSSYQRKIDANAERNRRRSNEANNIGQPDLSTINHSRKTLALSDLKTFYETYFSSVFHLGWSQDHLKVIEKIESAVIRGELSAISMPRGSGKTSLVSRAVLWALLSGRRHYIAVIAATEGAAQDLLRALKVEFLHNELLAEDFPAELHCVRSLANRAAMSNGQHVDGELTGVQWGVNKICLGYVDHPDSESTNYGIIQALGLTGSIRGLQVTLPTGEIRRPDLVLVDDPQTKQSAGSASQNQKRYETLMADVLGLAGPGVSIAGLLTCTVVYANDLADRLLDREQSPVWRGERCQLVYKWPESEEAVNLWDEYSVRYQEALRLDSGMESINDFVKSNFDAMHEGSVVGWEDRYDKSKELSALQHAYNLKSRDEAAFASEYQNMPMSSATELPFDLNADMLAKRIVPGLKRGDCPDDVEHLVASIDIQKHVIFYTVVGFTGTSKGYIVEYGTYPDQRRTYFGKSSLASTIQEAAGTDDLEGSIRNALDKLTLDLFTRDFGNQNVEKISIDARWGESTEIIRRWCRQNIYRSQVHPSLGMFIGANSRPWQKLKRSATDTRGVHCKLQVPTNGGRKELLLDTNWWKTTVARRLTCTSGSSKSLVLYDDSPVKHRMMSEHLSSEVPKISVGKTGTTVTEWSMSRNDNDWLDCVVYAHALASTLGVPFVQERKKHTSSKDFAKAASSSSVTASRDRKETARDRMMARKRRAGS